MSDNITINSREQFAQSLTALEALLAQAPDKAKAADAVLEAVAAEAGKGVVSPGGAGSGGSGTLVSPVYSSSITALGEPIKSVGDLVSAASNSLHTAIGDLRSLLTNLSDIDDNGAAEVTKA